MTSAPRVLFVCLGNICRSPTAEAVLRKMAPELQVDSAGTGGWHIGNPPHPPAIKAAKTRGYDLSVLRARQFSTKDFYDFDLILGMDKNNVESIEVLRPANVDTPVKLFLSFAPETAVSEVPDPYYTGNYEQALELIESAAAGLIRNLKT